MQDQQARIALGLLTLGLGSYFPDEEGAWSGLPACGSLYPNPGGDEADSLMHAVCFTIGANGGQVLRGVSSLLEIGHQVGQVGDGGDRDAVILLYFLNG